MKKFSVFLLIYLALFSFSSQAFQCASLLGVDQTNLTIQTVLQLGEVHRGEREDSEEFATLSISILVDAIGHHSFKDTFLDGLRQARKYLDDKVVLSTREKLLRAIIEFNIRDSNSYAHVERAIQIIESIPVPSRRRPEFNWHLAEFYYKLGNVQRAYNLVVYILHTAVVQPKTLLYFHELHKEMGQPDLQVQTARVVQQNRYNRLASSEFNSADWGPYLRPNPVFQ